MGNTELEVFAQSAKPVYFNYKNMAKKILNFLIYLFCSLIKKIYKYKQAKTIVLKICF